MTVTSVFGTKPISANRALSFGGRLHCVITQLFLTATQSSVTSIVVFYVCALQKIYLNGENFRLTFFALLQYNKCTFRSTERFLMQTLSGRNCISQAASQALNFKLSEAEKSVKKLLKSL